MSNEKNKWLTFSLIAAVLIVLLDIAELIRYSSFSINDINQVSSVAGDMACVFVIYWLLCTCILMPILRISKLDPTNFDVGLAVFLVVSHAFYLIHSHVKFGHYLSDLRLPALTMASFIIALIISIFLANLLKKTRQNTWKKYLQRIGLCMGAVLIIATLTNELVTNLKHPSVAPDKPTVRLANAPKHVIVIVIDTLRADAISCINKDTRTTPNIDALASDGVLFNNARSTSPWTTPSVSSILTGLSPLVHRALTTSSKLPNECNTIAEYFDQQNYQTAGFAQNPMLVGRNLEQGFDLFKHQSKSCKYLPLQKLLMKHLLNISKKGSKSSWATKQAIEWLDNNSQHHGFLYIHYLDPHIPYAPSKDCLPKGNIPKRIGKTFSNYKSVRTGLLVLTQSEKTWVNELYKAEAADVDKNIGTIINYLKNKGIYDQALIVLVSDHGEEFWEHENLDHGHTLYNELLHVPLIIKMPSQAIKKTIDSRIDISSITPTVLDICNIEYNPKGMSAPSLAPDITKGTMIAPKNIVSTGLAYYENRIAAEFGDFKYIEHLENGKQELYNLKDDPYELVNIAKDHPNIINRAKNIITTNNEKSQALRKHYNLNDVETADLDKKTLEMLRSLGYIE
jgi:arylsulfatase A-like enzyme